MTVLLASRLAEEKIRSASHLLREAAEVGFGLPGSDRERVERQVEAAAAHATLAVADQMSATNQHLDRIATSLASLVELFKAIAAEDGITPGTGGAR